MADKITDYQSALPGLMAALGGSKTVTTSNTVPLTTAYNKAMAGASMTPQEMEAMIKAVFQTGAQQVPVLTQQYANATGSRVSGNSGLQLALRDLNQGLSEKATAMLLENNARNLQIATQAGAGISQGSRTTTQPNQAAAMGLLYGGGFLLNQADKRGWFDKWGSSKAEATPEPFSSTQAGGSLQNSWGNWTQSNPNDVGTMQWETNIPAGYTGIDGGTDFVMMDGTGGAAPGGFVDPAAFGGGGGGFDWGATDWNTDFGSMINESAVDWGALDNFSNDIDFSLFANGGLIGVRPNAKPRGYQDGGMVQRNNQLGAQSGMVDRAGYASMHRGAAPSMMPGVPLDNPMLQQLLQQLIIQSSLQQIPNAAVPVNPGAGAPIPVAPNGPVTPGRMLASGGQIRNMNYQGLPAPRMGVGSINFASPLEYRQNTGGPGTGSGDSSSGAATAGNDSTTAQGQTGMDPGGPTGLGLSSEAATGLGLGLSAVGMGVPGGVGIANAGNNNAAVNATVAGLAGLAVGGLPGLAVGMMTGKAMNSTPDSIVANMMSQSQQSAINAMNAAPNDEAQQDAVQAAIDDGFTPSPVDAMSVADANVATGHNADGSTAASTDGSTAVGSTDGVGGPGSPGGWKNGGLVLGPGTGTSDSIPVKSKDPGGANIRYSDREYVIPEDIVRRFGTDYFDRLLEAFHTPVTPRASRV